MCKHKGTKEEKSQYIKSIKYLEDLKQQIYEHLNQYRQEISKEYLLISGVVNSIKNELKEDIDDIGKVILSELRNKYLEDFNKEEHIYEYRFMLDREYIKELRRREYSWNILSLKLLDRYFRDELYKELKYYR